MSAIVQYCNLHALPISYPFNFAAILVGLAYLFLGEQPSSLGIIGVGIIALGGYLLSRMSTTVASGQQPLRPDLDDKENKISKPWLFWRRRTFEGGGPTAEQHLAIASDMAVASGFNSQGQSKAASRATSYVNLPAGDVESGGTGSIVVDQTAVIVSSGRKKSGPSSSLAPSGGDDPGSEKKQQQQQGLQVDSSSFYVFPFKALSQQPGSLMMIGVAVCWSLTASLDKVFGALHMILVMVP